VSAAALVLDLSVLAMPGTHFRGMPVAHMPLPGFAGALSNSIVGEHSFNLYGPTLGTILGPYVERDAERPTHL
jgi:hypothetical protein